MPRWVCATMWSLTPSAGWASRYCGDTCCTALSYVELPDLSWLEELGLGLVTWWGRFEDMDGLWLRPRQGSPAAAHRGGGGSPGSSRRGACPGRATPGPAARAGRRGVGAHRYHRHARVIRACPSAQRRPRRPSASCAVRMAFDP
jgi:hypothetical protein